MVGYATVTFVDGRSSSESESSIFNSKGGADVNLRESAAGRVLARGCPAWVTSGDAGIVVSWSVLRILGARHARPAADVLVLDRALAAISPGWVAELVAKVDAASEAEWPPGLEPDLFLAEFDRRAEIALADGAVTEADLALNAADTVALRTLSPGPDGAPPSSSSSADGPSGLIYGAMVRTGSRHGLVARSVEVMIGPRDSADACATAVEVVGNLLAAAAGISPEDISGERPAVARDEMWLEGLTELSGRLPPVELLAMGASALAQQRFFKALLGLLIAWTSPLICAAACFFVLDADDGYLGKGYEPIYAAALVFVSSYVIADSVATVFACCIDTIYICAFKDMRENDPPKFMSNDLREAFGIDAADTERGPGTGPGYQPVRDTASVSPAPAAKAGAAGVLPYVAPPTFSAAVGGVART